MSCRSDAFENPVIQQHYRNLEALALDMMAPEEIEDLISKMADTNRDPASSCGSYNHCLSSLSHSFSVCPSSSSCSASVPKVEQIDQRLGPLIQDFKDLVYPADYDPNTKPAPKRKTGESRGLQWK